jgi:hypothetical protein
MTETGFIPCPYRVVMGSTHFHIEERGDEGKPSTWSGSIKFPHRRDEDSDLWLVRGASAGLIAEWRAGRLILNSGGWEVGPEGLVASANRLMLRDNDGFTIIKAGMACLPGPVSVGEWPTFRVVRAIY